MRILITIKGGSSSIEGEIVLPIVNDDRGLKASTETMEALVDFLRFHEFLILDKTSHGQVAINKSAIGYITRKQ